MQREQDATASPMQQTCCCSSVAAINCNCEYTDCRVAQVKREGADKQITKMLYVSPLPENVNNKGMGEKALKRMFEEYGTIIDCKVSGCCNEASTHLRRLTHFLLLCCFQCISCKSNENEYFGLVRFSSSLESERAIRELHEKRLIKGKLLQVVYARKDALDRASTAQPVQSPRPGLQSGLRISTSIPGEQVITLHSVRYSTATPYLHITFM